MARSLLTALMVALLLAPRCLAQQPSSPESSDSTHLHRITGVVIDDSSGRPLSGAIVQIQTVILRVSCMDCKQPLAPASAEELDPPGHATTGADGAFAFNNVPEKSISITATKPHYFDAWNARRHPNEPTTIYSVKQLSGPIILRLAPAASISGTLRDQKGNVVRKDASVTLWHLASWSGWPRLEYANSAQVEPDGSYHFRDLQPGHYYLIANPPVGSWPPPADMQDHAVGQVPIRYPEWSSDRANSFFTLRAGESANLNFRFAQQPLHHVSGVLQMSQPYSFDIIDQNGSGAYLFNASPIDNKFEAWLPDGNYYVSTGREGDVAGPLPFEVKGSDLSDLSFAIATPERINVPIEISSVEARGTACSDETPACGFFLADLVRFQAGDYVEVVDGSSFTNKIEGNPAKRVEMASLIPGDYTVAVAVTNNIYARSIVSGATNLALDRLNIAAGESPQAIRIVLAEGAMADGIVLREGNPAPAWVYAVAQDIESKTDFRVFQPVASDADGKFRIEGLAPGSYLFFASDIELPLDVHDPPQLDYWRPRGEIARVESGKTTHLVLDYAVAPDVP